MMAWAGVSSSNSGKLHLRVSMPGGFVEVAKALCGRMATFDGTSVGMAFTSPDLCGGCIRTSGWMRYTGRVAEELASS